MPFPRPTLSGLVTRIYQDFKGGLEEISDAPTLRKSVVGIISIVWAGATHSVHGHIAWAVKQLFVATAERPSLVVAGRGYKMAPIPAAFASGTVAGTGVNGTVVPTGRSLRRSDGATFIVTADATVSGGVVAIDVTAGSAGAAGNTDAGEELAFENPVSGVDPTVTVSAPGITGGSDAEDTELYRSRLLARQSDPPEGGADHDYIEWAKEVPGVTRVWVYRYELGLGTVVVRFVRDTDVDIIPDAGAVADVQAKLDSERPTTAEVTAAAPVAVPVDFDVLLTPNTAAVREAAASALADLLERYAEPGDGATSRGTLPIAKIDAALGGVADDFVLNSPTANVVPGLGELLVLGTLNLNPP